MPATGDRSDPYASFNFLVEIDGVTVAGFSECSGLSTDLSKEMVEVHKCMQLLQRCESRCVLECPIFTMHVYLSCIVRWISAGRLW